MKSSGYFSLIYSQFRVVLLLIASLMLSECGQQRLAAPTVASPIGLHIGISLDSAKHLLKTGGWVYDSLVIDNASITRIRFLNLHISGIDRPLQGVLGFQNGNLLTIALGESPMNKTWPTGKDYRQLVSYATSVYGNPTYMDSASNHPGTYWNFTTEKGPVTYDIHLIGGRWLLFAGSYSRYMYPPASRDLR